MPERYGYGQFCPVSMAAEVFCSRWTPLILRELLMGTTRFNELRRGVPKMSPALLSKRLRSLERAGIVTRSGSGGRTSYTVTERGRELEPIVNALGLWGLRWIGDLGEEDLDPHLLLWDMKRTLPVDAWPRARTVVAFAFDDVPRKDAAWWVVVSGGEVDICDYDPGFDVIDLLMGQGDERGGSRMIRVWRARSWAHFLLLRQTRDDQTARAHVEKLIEQTACEYALMLLDVQRAFRVLYWPNRFYRDSMCWLARRR